MRVICQGVNKVKDGRKTIRKKFQVWKSKGKVRGDYNGKGKGEGKEWEVENDLDELEESQGRIRVDLLICIFDSLVKKLSLTFVTSKGNLGVDTSVNNRDNIQQVKNYFFGIRTSITSR